jgi:hypothetical protein
MRVKVMKKITFLIMLLISLNASALPESLNDYVLKNTTWKTDISSKSFMATRCSVINLMVSERLSGDNRENRKNLADKYIELATIFAEYSDLLFKTGGGSNDKFKERALHWTKIYGEEAVYNINNYNNMTNGEFGQDLLFCNQSFYEVVIQDIDKLSKSDSTANN